MPQASGGISTLHSRASGLQSTTQGIPSGPKRLLRVERKHNRQSRGLSGMPQIRVRVVLDAPVHAYGFHNNHRILVTNMFVSLLNQFFRVQAHSKSLQEETRSSRARTLTRGRGERLRRDLPDISRISLEIRQNFTRISPESHPKITAISSYFRHTFTRISNRSTLTKGRIRSVSIISIFEFSN